MAIKMKLPAALFNALDQARADLEDFVNEQRDERENKSEKWQEGEKAQAHETWLDELNTAVEALNDISAEASE